MSNIDIANPDTWADVPDIKATLDPVDIANPEMWDDLSNVKLDPRMPLPAPKVDDSLVQPMIKASSSLFPEPEQAMKIAEYAIKNNVDFAAAEYQMNSQKLKDGFDPVLLARNVEYMMKNEQFAGFADRRLPKTRKYVTWQGTKSIAENWRDLHRLTGFEWLLEEGRLAHSIGNNQQEIQAINIKDMKGLASEGELRKRDFLSRNVQYYNELNKDKGFFSQSFRGLIKDFIPMLVGATKQGVYRGAQGATAGAAGATVLGLSGVGIPAAVATIAKSAGAGFGAGAGEYIYEQSSAEVFASLMGLKDRQGKPILDRDTALAISSGTGLAMFALESLGLGAMSKAIPKGTIRNLLPSSTIRYLDDAGKKLVQVLQKNPKLVANLGEGVLRFLYAWGVETGTEVLQEGTIVGAEALGIEIAQSRGKDVLHAKPSEVKDRLLEAGEQAMYSTFYPLSVGSAFTTIQSVRQRTQYEKLTAQVEREIIKGISKNVQESQLGNEAPTVFENALKFTTQGQSFYFEPQVLNVLFQSEEGQSIAQSMGIDAEQVADALDMGVDVAIPIYKQTKLMKSQFWGELEQHAKITPSGKNEAQAQSLLADDPEAILTSLSDFKNSLDEAETQSDAMLLRQQNWQEWTAGYREQLKQAGYTDLQADSFGNVLAAHAEVMAPMFGVSAQDYLAQRLAGIQYVTPKQFTKSLEKGRSLSQKVIQAISSADTSLRQVASALKKIPFESGTVNIDIGGDKYDEGTNYLAEQGVENLVFDPFNRDEAHNRQVFERLKAQPGDTVTATNVLNVIAEPEVRQEVVRQAAKAVKADGVAYFQIYEGDGKGEGRATSKGYQNNAKTAFYLDDVKTWFQDVKKRGNIIEARNPKQDDGQAMWLMEGFDGAREFYQGEKPLAANGKPSNLSPKLWETVRTPEFKAWFGDWENDPVNASKVVDENGEPLVVYHGSGAEFDTFSKEKLGSSTKARSAKKGFFFSRNPKTAEGYAYEAAQNRHYAEIDRKVELLRQELESVEGIDFDREEALLEQIDDLEYYETNSVARNGSPKYQTTYSTFLNIKNPNTGDAEGKTFDFFRHTLNDTIDDAIKSNNDGAIVLRINDGARPGYEFEDTHYIVFNPNQIKSIENRGTFSAESDNIYYQTDQTPQVTPETARGAFSQTNVDGQFMISLFKGKKDISTIVHEGAGHFFLENLREAAALGNAPQWVKDDWATISAAIGADMDASKPIPEAAHEAYATMAVEYFRKGKAPSTELRTAFRMFGRWLADIYKQLKRMFDFSEISPEVEAVMDRLIATEQDIENSKSWLDDDITVDDVTDTNKWTEYQKLKAKAKKDGEASIALRRLDEQRKVEREAALEAKILMATEQDMVDVEHIKDLGGINFDDLIEAYGEETAYTLLDRWNTYGRNLIRKKGGISLDEVMTVLQAEDPDSVHNFLIGNRTQRDFIDAVVEQRLSEWQENYSPEIDMVATASADAALRARDEAVTGQEQVSTKSLMDATEKSVKNMPFNEVDATFERLRAGEKKQKVAQRVAKEQISKQDRVVERLKTSRDNLLSSERKRRALLAVTYRTRILREETKRKIKNIVNQKSLLDPFRQQMLAIINNFDGLGTKGMKPREGTPSLNEFFLAWAEANGFEAEQAPTAPTWMSDFANREKNYSMNDLSMEQLQDLHTLFKQLRQMSNTSGAIIGTMYDMQIKEAVSKTTESMNTLREKKHIDDIARRTLWGKLRILMRESHAEKSIMRYIFKAADGFVSFGKNLAKGWNEKLLHNTLMQAQNKKLIWQDEFSKKIKDAFKPLNKINLTKPFAIPGIVLPSDVARDWRNMWNMEKVLALALNMGNEGNKKAIYKGYNLEAEEVTRILDTYMTPELWDVVQNVWDIIEEIAPLLDETQQTLFGVPLTRVEATPLISMINGQATEYRGGYYPLMFDRRFSDVAGRNEDTDMALNTFEALQRKPNPKSGFTKERKGAGLPPLLSLSVISRHIEDSLHYAAFAVPIRNVYTIITNKDYKDSFIRAFGIEQYEELLPWLRSIARPEPRLNDKSAKIANWLAKRGTLAALGFSFRTAFMGFTSITNSIHRVGYTKFLGVMARMAVSPYGKYKMITELSPYMANRATLMDRDVRSALNEHFNEGNLIKIGGVRVTRVQFEKSAYAMIMAVDAVINLPAWLAQYEKALDAGMTMEEAIQAGDDAVFEAQAGGGAVDTSALLRKDGWGRLFTGFMTYMNNQYNRNSYYFKALMQHRSNKDTSPVGYGEFAHYAAMNILVPSILVSLLISLGMEDEEPEAKDVAWEIISVLTGSMPLVRLGVSALRYKTTPSSAGLKGLENVGDAARGLIETGEATWKGKSTSDKHLYYTMKSVINAAGFATGVPTSQIFRTLEGADALEKGQGGVLSPLLGKPYRKKSNQSDIF